MAKRRKARTTMLLQSQIEQAMKVTRSNKAAAEYLRVSYPLYRKFAKLYKNDNGVTLFQQHYNHSYSSSQGRYDLNGYEIPLQVNNGSDGAVFASNGGTDLLIGLDNQYKSNLKPFRN